MECLETPPSCRVNELKVDKFNLGHCVFAFVESTNCVVYGLAREILSYIPSMRGSSGNPNTSSLSIMDARDVASPQTPQRRDRHSMPKPFQSLVQIRLEKVESPARIASRLASLNPSQVKQGHSYYLV